MRLIRLALRRALYDKAIHRDSASGPATEDYRDIAAGFKGMRNFLLRRDFP
jgi:hypothetical protein